MVTRTVYKHIRGFVIIWLSITFALGLATFLAIYFTYNPSATDPGASNPLLLETAGEKLPEEELMTPTSMPSDTPVPSATPTPAPPSPTSPIVAEEAADKPTLTRTSAPSPTPTPWPVLDMRYQVGIQVDQSPDLSPDSQDAWYNSVVNDLSMSWVKHQIRWERTETEPGKIDWSVLDTIVQSAEKFGIKFLLSIVTAPDWAREPEAFLGRHGPPADPKTFANFVAKIVERYPGRIHAIEVWHEQNIDREWTSVEGLNAKNYVALLRTTHQAVRAIDPGIIIVSGALSPTGVNDGSTAYNDFNFMDQLIEAGMLDWSDCVGAHHNGYNVGPDHRYNEIPDDPTASFRGPFDNPHHSWSFRSTLEGYANRIRAAGKDTKLCVTEFGWPVAEDLEGVSASFGFAHDNTLQEQAEWIPRAMTNMEEWGFVWLAFIWNFNFGPQAGWAADNDNVPYSLIGPDFTFRPAYDSIRAWQQDYLTRTGS